MLSHHDVARLNVAVYDTDVVRRLQRRGDLLDDEQRTLNAQGAHGLQFRSKRWPVHIFHDEETDRRSVIPVDLPKVEDGDYARMTYGAGSPSFAPKPLTKLVVIGVLGAQ